MCALVAMSASVAYGDGVTSDKALRIAREVLAGATRGGDVAVAWDSSALGTTRGADEMPTFYVISATLGSGFVIVAGDDALCPVLAYSPTYAAPSSAVLPPSFEGWLRYIDSAVRYAREHRVVADDVTAQLWSEAYKPVDAVMLNTARWSQVPPYNDQCPLDGDAHSLTGCTQTAMAIIMRHHRWPERAWGVTESYVTATRGIEVGARDLNHAYDWDNMLDTYVEGKYNDAEAEAVAVLMADLGHAFKADYTAVDTGAMPDYMSLYKNFGYSPAANVVVRRLHSDDFWKSMLRKEIEAGRPLYYAGYTAEGAGHAFVLDGVDENDYFHVNWGWGGVYDGFFMIDTLTLGEEYLFDTQHWAVFGMHPMRDGEVENWLSLASVGLSTSTKVFERGVAFEISPISLSNSSQLDFYGEVRVALCDKAGEIKSWTTDAVSITLPSLYVSSTDRLRGVIDDDIAEGDRLALFYCSRDGERWHRVESSVESACSEIIVKHTPIGDTTSMWFDKESGILVVKYDDDVKSALYFLDEYIETGVTITKGRMLIDTKLLQRGASYTIYLERKDVESKSIMFTLNQL